MTPAAAALLTQWITEGAPVRAIAAATASAGFGDAIVVWSERVTPETRAQLIAILAAQIDASWPSAIALGRLGAIEHSAAIARAFAESKQLFTQGYARALALLAQRQDSAVVLAAIDRGPERAWAAHQALCAMNARSPLLAAYTDRDSLARAVNNAWTRPPLDAPRIITGATHSATERSFAIDHGRGHVRIEPERYDGGAWPQWNRALTIARAPLYAVSSGCDTCASLFALSGSLDASREALARYRANVRALRSLDDPGLDAIEPLLHQLETGRYLASLIDVRLRPSRSAREGWFGDPDAVDAANDAGPLRYESAPVTIREDNTGCMVLGPTQPSSALDDEIVRMYASEIRDGSRPVALALTWVEERYEGGWDTETPLRTSVLGALLDGHHKLEAYAREGIAARVLSLCALGECSTQQAFDERPVRAAMAALSGPA